MKKFTIVSVCLILVAAIFFSFSLWHYIDVKNGDAVKSGKVDKVDKDNKDKEDEDSENAVMPAEWQDGGIFSENYDKAYKYVKSMSTEQMVGQIILGSCPTDDSATDTISKYSLGGYYFTQDNFTSLDEAGVKDLIASYQKKAKTPMIMSVEEEGGAVTAISDLEAFTEYDFSSARSIYEEEGLDAVKESEVKKAQMLSSVGINLNIGPVCDMAEEFTQIMYSRSLGGTVSECSEYAKSTTKTSQDKGVSVALKHFPGYGTIPDTYLPIVTDSREANTFETRDFLPFEAGIKEGAHFVLMSNILVEKMDPNCVASLSDYVHTILRNELKFTGLIVTDNLNNSDYSEYSNGKNVYVQAVLAGNDVIMVDDIGGAYNEILSAVNNGTIEKETLEKACTRVIAYKYTAGIMK